MKQRILIPMIEAGSGHRSPALAIRAALERLYPNRFEIEVVDLADACGAHLIDTIIKEFWDYALAHPRFATRLNVLVDRLNWLTKCNAGTRVFMRDFMRKGMRYIIQFDPDLVVSTHFFATSVAAIARRKAHLDFPLYSYVTDPFYAHNLWVNPLVDGLIVASDEARAQMLDLGAKPETLMTMAYPLHERFFRPVFSSGGEKAAMLRSLELDPEKKTVIVTAGGQGIGNAMKFARSLFMQDVPMNIIAVCGKNEELLRELNIMKATRESGECNLALFGYVDNMHELLSLADFSISKAGANATLEMLVKRVPPIFTQCAALIEKGNIDWCVENEVGWWCDDPDEFVRLVRELTETDLAERVRARMESSLFIRNLEGAADRIAEMLVAHLPAWDGEDGSAKASGG